MKAQRSGRQERGGGGGRGESWRVTACCTHDPETLTEGCGDAACATSTVPHPPHTGRIPGATGGTPL